MIARLRSPVLEFPQKTSRTEPDWFRNPAKPQSLKAAASPAGAKQTQKNSQKHLWLRVSQLCSIVGKTGLSPEERPLPGDIRKWVNGCQALSSFCIPEEKRLTPLDARKSNSCSKSAVILSPGKKFKVNSDLRIESIFGRTT